MILIPSLPSITHVSGPVFHLSVPVVIDGQPYHFVRWSEGLSAVLGDNETYNVFVCSVSGRVLDWTGLCHIDESFDGPSWLYSLAGLQDEYET